MKLELHHFRFAFLRSAWVLALFLVVMIYLSVRDGLTVEDFLWGMSPGLIIWAGFFGYWLWRTQRRLPAKGRDTTDGDVHITDTGNACDGDSGGE